MSAPAPTTARVLASARFEATTVLRNGEQLLVSIVLPLMALVLLTYAPYPVLDTPRIDVVTPGVLALAVVSTAFTGQAISTGFDRRYGVLRLLGVSPLGRGGLLAGKAIAVLAVLTIQVLILGVAALALGWRPDPVGLVPLAISLVLGALCFVALALLLAGALRAEAVLAAANLLWVVFLGLGLLLPTSTLPATVATVAAWVPSGLLGDAARTAAIEGGWPLVSWAVLLLWTAVAGAVARRVFRWSD
ncbi:MAG: ABC transporter permease [Dermatophilaceae bacterium]|nr:ABC transporter permease [Intrasporangiaceae bacterium]